ncbi:MAG: TonB family protein [Verrucomicrobiota bacterium]
MTSFSRSLIGSVVLHTGFFLGASALLMKDSQWGVEAGESGAAGTMDARAQAIQVEVSEPEPPSEQEAVAEVEPIVSEFEMAPVVPKVREENRPEPHKTVEAPKTEVRKVASTGSSASTAGGNSVGAVGSGGARVADRADYLRNPPPAYPSDAKKRGEEGTVVLMVELSDSGSVESVSVTSSSGHSILDRSALDAVRHWRFQPAKMGGIGIKSSVKVPIRFDLQKS